MGIKGKTTFELTDVNTGTVEKFEDTNMITNALQNFLNTYGMFANSVLYDNAFRSREAWKNLVGGLMLFDKTIEEDADNTFMPAGVKMVGNGCYDVSNNGSVLELGSFNTTESGEQTDGSIKFVYDFSTQQANGTIQCACLTSDMGGYIGMGNNNNVSYNIAGYNLNAYQGTYNNSCNIGIKYGNNQTDTSCIMFPVYEEDAIYMVNPKCVNYNANYPNDVAVHWGTTGKIQILKVRAGFKNIGLKDYSILNQIMQTWDVTIPQEITDYMGTSRNYAKAYSNPFDRSIFVIFSKNYNVNNGSFCWVMKIDENMSATAYRVTNSTGGYFRADTPDTVVFQGEYMYMKVFKDNKYCLYGIKYTDSTQIIETDHATTSYNTLWNIDVGLIGLIYEGINNYNNRTKLVYDIVNNTIKQPNGAEPNEVRVQIPFVDRKGTYLCATNSNSGTVKVIKDVRYLATINNLDEPVIKTASKTMKVTYTITFED